MKVSTNLVITLLYTCLMVTVVMGADSRDQPAQSGKLSRSSSVLAASTHLIP